MQGSAGTLSAALARPQPGWRKRLLWGGAVLLALVNLIGWPYYSYLAGERELREALVEADRLDPGWRFEDLEAAREKIPDAENGAILVLSAHQLMPARWLLPPPGTQAPGIDEILGQLLPNEQLDEKHTRELRAALKQAAAALHAARRLADFPRGRYAVAWTADGIGTIMRHLDQLNQLNRMLILDSALRAQDGSVEEALRSCLAALNGGRSIGDEPAVISQLVRLSWQVKGIRGVERVLAQSEPPATALERLQRLLDREPNEGLLLVAARGERAMLYQALEVLRARKFDRRSFDMYNRFGLPDKVLNWFDAAKANRCEAVYLRYLTEFVEVAKQPEAQRRPRLEELQKPRLEMPDILENMGRGLDERKLARRFSMSQALLRCAIAGLAAERYRQANGRWPAGLQELVPAYLRELPTNPFDDGPLRYHRLKDGVSIQAAGSNGQSGGSGFGRGPLPEESGVGFRLWDVQQRGRPRGN